MFLIVEGVTCAGKSTLIEQLRERLCADSEVQLEHKGMPQELTRRSVLKDYVLNYEGYVPGSPVSIVADRWHYGEATYAPIYRPDTNQDGFGLLGVAGWRWVEMFLMSRGAVVVRLDAPDHILVDRLKTRGDDHVKDPHELLQVAQRYRDVEPFCPTLEFTIDTGLLDDPVDIDPIWFKGLQQEAASAEILQVTPEYIGSLRPDVLLIGDQRNVTKTYGNETTLPFMPVNASSGVYLMESLHADLWPVVGMINGNDMTGDLRELWEVLGRPRPVALGRRAESALQASGFAGMEYTALDHPAYTRRFKHASQAAYGTSISEAAEMKGIYA